MRSMHLIAISATLLSSTALHSAEPKSLLATAADRQSILQTIEKDPELAKALAGKKKVVMTAMRESPVEENQVTDTASQEVEVLHYSYDDRRTIRSTYSARTKTVTKVDLLEAYPTPLAESELKNAEEIAIASSPEYKAAYEKTPADQRKLRHLVPLYSDRANPLFGKRVVVLMLSPKGQPGQTVKVNVDLTDQTVLVTAPAPATP